MKQLVAVLCIATGLAVTTSAVAGAASLPGVGAVEQRIGSPVRQDPGDDWIPWDRVIHVYGSQQECLSAGQTLADAYHNVYHCQQTKSGSWVLFQ